MIEMAKTESYIYWMRTWCSCQGIASVLLLLSYGADVNSMADSRHDYRTVLHYAILGGDPTVIDLLLKQGARLDLGPEYQKPTALDLAILKGDPSIVQMLLKSGKFACSCLSRLTI